MNISNLFPKRLKDIIKKKREKKKEKLVYMRM